MANAARASIQFVDADGVTNFADIRHIKGIKYIGNASGTAQINADSGGSVKIWEESGTSNAFDNVHIISLSKGISVVLSNGASLYIYF